MSTPDILALVAAALAAGMINAIAGGGTLISFPVLLFVGTPSLTANATSTLALVLGTFGGLYGYRAQLPAIRPWLKRFVPISMVGGLLGGILLTLTKEALFSKMVPYLILFATVLFVAQGAFRRFAGFGDKPSTVPAHQHQRTVWLAITFQFLVAVYGGYFGEGIGILMLASLCYLNLGNIYEMNALKTLLGSLINLVASVYFIFAGLIDWQKMFIMTVGAVAGYYLGAQFSQRISQVLVRQIISAIGFIISAVMFLIQFGLLKWG
jgi:uncharacterized membrane protein YfcA